MAIKASFVDDDTLHLVIGLTRKNMNTLLNGNVLILPAGYLTGFTENSDVVLLFAETEKDLERRLPPALKSN